MKEQFRIEDRLIEANDHIGNASNIFHSFSDSHELRQLPQIQEADRHILDAHRIIEALLTRARPDDGIELSPIEARKRLPFLERNMTSVLLFAALGGWTAAIPALLTYFTR